MTDNIQRASIRLGACMGGPAHEWRVSAWADIEPDAENPGRGRAAVAFFCARCLAQVDAATVYAPPESVESDDVAAAPADQATPAAQMRRLRRLRDELAQAEVVGAGTPDGEVAGSAATAVEWALSQMQPPTV